MENSIENSEKKRKSGTQSSIKDFLVLKKLGDGSFSQVFLVKRLSDQQEYAIKKVKLSQLNEKEKQNALNEVRMLASINHPNVVQYKEAFFDEDTSCLCLVMEFCQEGDILKKIKVNQKTKNYLKEADIWKYLVEMTRGLKALHDMNILHRDLKCANIFLAKDGTAKLGDLNVSKEAKCGLLQTQTGTPYYASPEVWRDEPYDLKSDIWSLGCVLYEICAFKPPFRANDMPGLFKEVQKGIYDPLPLLYSQDLSKVLSELLKVSPNQRPNCDQILNNIIVKRHINSELNNINLKLSQKAKLLETIILPQNLGNLKEKLPKPKYQINKNYSYEAEQILLDDDDNDEKNKQQANIYNFRSPNYTKQSQPILNMVSNQKNEDEGQNYYAISRPNQPQQQQQQYKRPQRVLSAVVSKQRNQIENIQINNNVLEGVNNSNSNIINQSQEIKQLLQKNIQIQQQYQQQQNISRQEKLESGEAYQQIQQQQLQQQQQQQPMKRLIKVKQNEDFKNNILLSNQKNSNFDFIENNNLKIQSPILNKNIMISNQLVITPNKGMSQPQQVSILEKNQQNKILEDPKIYNENLFNMISPNNEKNVQMINFNNNLEQIIPEVNTLTKVQMKNQNQSYQNTDDQQQYQIESSNKKKQSENIITHKFDLESNSKDQSQQQNQQNNINVNQNQNYISNTNSNNRSKLVTQNHPKNIMDIDKIIQQNIQKINEKNQMSNKKEVQQTPAKNISVNQNEIIISSCQKQIEISGQKIAESQKLYKQNSNNKNNLNSQLLSEQVQSQQSAFEIQKPSAQIPHNLNQKVEKKQFIRKTYNNKNLAAYSSQQQNINIVIKPRPFSGINQKNKIQPSIVPTQYKRPESSKIYLSKNQSQQQQDSQIQQFKSPQLGIKENQNKQIIRTTLSQQQPLRKILVKPLSANVYTGQRSILNNINIQNTKLKNIHEQLQEKEMSIQDQQNKNIKEALQKIQGNSNYILPQINQNISNYNNNENKYGQYQQQQQYQMKHLPNNNSNKNLYRNFSANSYAAQARKQQLINNLNNAQSKFTLNNENIVKNNNLRYSKPNNINNIDNSKYLNQNKINVSGLERPTGLVGNNISNQKNQILIEPQKNSSLLKSQNTHNPSSQSKKHISNVGQNILRNFNNGLQNKLF